MALISVGVAFNIILDKLSQNPWNKKMQNHLKTYRMLEWKGWVPGVPPFGQSSQPIFHVSHRTSF